MHLLQPSWPWGVSLASHMPSEAIPAGTASGEATSDAEAHSRSRPCESPVHSRVFWDLPFDPCLHQDASLHLLFPRAKKNLVSTQPWVTLSSSPLSETWTQYKNSHSSYQTAGQEQMRALRLHTPAALQKGKSSGPKCFYLPQAHQSPHGKTPVARSGLGQGSRGDGEPRRGQQAGGCVNVCP